MTNSPKLSRDDAVEREAAAMQIFAQNEEGSALIFERKSVTVLTVSSLFALFVCPQQLGTLGHRENRGSNPMKTVNYPDDPVQDSSRIVVERAIALSKEREVRWGVHNLEPPIKKRTATEGKISRTLQDLRVSAIAVSILTWTAGFRLLLAHLRRNVQNLICQPVPLPRRDRKLVG
jgi:hypothetical protein